jgi:hypothetical protein
MPGTLFAYRPEHCPFGHDLTPGRVKVAWTPCTCQPAREAASHGFGLGHVRVHCLACEDDGTSTVGYRPSHDTSHASRRGQA